MDSNASTPATQKKISAKEQGFYIYCCSSSW
jgi:hypothetical protein